jgi:hypothetical protein
MELISEIARTNPQLADELIGLLNEMDWARIERRKTSSPEKGR